MTVRSLGVVVPIPLRAFLDPNRAWYGHKRGGLGGYRGVVESDQQEWSCGVSLSKQLLGAVEFAKALAAVLDARERRQVRRRAVI
jgi:hypothetical protein